LFHTLRLKEIGFLGNPAVAFCVLMTVVLVGLAAGAVNGLVATFGALACVFELGEGIAPDVMDGKGDRIRPWWSLTANARRTFSLRLSGVVFSLIVALTFLPYLAGWLGPVYLLYAMPSGRRARPVRDDRGGVPRRRPRRVEPPVTVGVGDGRGARPIAGRSRSCDCPRHSG
jgi:4-hydroxybenzoate polyprenyltransferase